VINRNGAHDIVVIGASAGGVEALCSIVAGLPAGYPAAVLVVLHILPDAPSALAQILSRSGALKAIQARHLQSIERGHIYVAAPNRHLVLHRGHIALETGPRENSARPAIDVLFRSAARAYGRRVVGVILSGALRDGALGLAAIKMRGGVTIVQDPSEAMFAGMPESALRTTEVDYCMSASSIPTCLVELVDNGVEQRHMHSSEHEPDQPSIHAADEPDAEGSPKLPNHASGLTCPECHGSLWELRDEDGIRYRCRVGHIYGLDALLSEQSEASSLITK
jgi:two-component system chemotaxis response regulator CheB